MAARQAMKINHKISYLRSTNHHQMLPPDFHDNADHKAYRLFQRPPSQKMYSDEELMEREKSAFKMGLAMGYKMGVQPKPGLLQRIVALFI